MFVPFSNLCAGIAVMRFQSPPVNSLSLDFLTEFAISMEKLEMDKSCKGVILTSVSGHTKVCTDSFWKRSVDFLQF